jgi:hypothetical protein
MAGGAYAEDCDRILWSTSPILVRGKLATIKGGAITGSLVTYRIMRAEDPVKVVMMTGPGNDPVAEYLLNDLGLATRVTLLKSNRVVYYEYSSSEGTRAVGTEFRYTRTARLNDPVKKWVESFVEHIDQPSVRRIGACDVEVIPIHRDVQNDSGDGYSARVLYAPYLMSFVQMESAGEFFPSPGQQVSIFSATSLDLAQ